VVLELGGNAAAIVTADADLKHAAQRLATSAFAYAGQVCIKVQRIIVETSVADVFRREFETATAALAVGDPWQESTVVGPLIDDASAERIAAWVTEAGGEVSRSGRLMRPLIMSNVPKQSTLYREEIFGPVVLLETEETYERALETANDSAYGLQAAVFTNNLAKARGAFHELEVGGVVLNDAPSLRSDNQPYGGVKSSGLGREGVRCAMEDYTEERVLLTAREPRSTLTNWT
jgi:acyl-CoA reductase-like NAD-dependent aldehyde dehydrogenase